MRWPFVSLLVLCGTLNTSSRVDSAAISSGLRLICSNEMMNSDTSQRSIQALMRLRGGGLMFREQNYLSEGLNTYRTAQFAAIPPSPVHYMLERTLLNPQPLMDGWDKLVNAAGRVAHIPAGLALMVGTWLGVGQSPRCSAKHIGWMKPKRVTDVTDEFAQMLHLVKSGQKVLPDSYSYMFVPGFMWRRYPGYFSESLAHFKRRGLDVSLAKVGPESSVSKNAAELRILIRKLFQRTGKPTVLIGHSKGGLDSLAALISDEELSTMVRGLVCIQSPLGGSPIATDIVHGPPFVRDAVHAGLTTLFRGSKAAIDDLTHQSRKAFYRAASTRLSRLSVPVLCFHSSTVTLFSFVSAPAMYISRIYSHENDGLVTRADAETHGALVVRAQGDLHHMAPVMPSPPWGYQVQVPSKRPAWQTRASQKADDDDDDEGDQSSPRARTLAPVSCNAAQLNEAVVATMLSNSRHTCTAPVHHNE